MKNIFLYVLLVVTVGFSVSGYSADEKSISAPEQSALLLSLDSKSDEIREYIAIISKQMALDSNSRYICELLDKLEDGMTGADFTEVLQQSSRGQEWSGRKAFSLMNLEDKIKANLITNETWMNRFYPEELAYMDGSMSKRLLELQKVKQVRVLSLPASHGDEAISVALLLERSNISNYEIHGLDVQEEVVKLANARISYSTAQRDPVYGRLREGEMESYRDLEPEIKNKLHFRQADVFKDEVPNKYDVILCRNFLGYFRQAPNHENDQMRDPVATVLRKLAGALNRDGCLILDQYIAGNNYPESEAVHEVLTELGLHQVDHLPIFVKVENSKIHF